MARDELKEYKKNTLPGEHSGNIDSLLQNECGSVLRATRVYAQSANVKTVLLLLLHMART